jgi:GTP-sensing pleiotropic transcriptional regulator CodY
VLEQEVHQEERYQVGVRILIPTLYSSEMEAIKAVKYIW